MGKEELYNKQNNYNRKKYDRVNLMLPKGDREKWKEEAKERNMSLNAFIQEAVKFYISENKNM